MRFQSLPKVGIEGRRFGNLLLEQAIYQRIPRTHQITGKTHTIISLDRLHNDP